MFKKLDLSTILPNINKNRMFAQMSKRHQSFKLDDDFQTDCSDRYDNCGLQREEF